MELFIDILKDTTIDTVKLIPFLFLTYLAMEYLENKAGQKTVRMLLGAGKKGPVIGGILGVVPQCGFSAAAANLYSGGVITVGTMIAVFLSTSDEMLPILISSSVGITRILHLLLVKAGIAMISGIAIDLVIRDCRKTADEKHHHHDHEGEQGCEERLALAALRHTMEVFIYIAGISFLLNLGIAIIGEDTLAGFFTSIPVLGEFLAALVGLIPNCASSVVITELYLSGVIGAGAMMSGLLVNAGVGILVLLRIDHDRKETAKIVAILYALGVFWGLVIEMLGVVF